MGMGVFSEQRLLAEYQEWCTDHPAGYVAAPSVDQNGNQNLYKWTCWIPGPPRTLWEGIHFQVSLTFNQDYPISPPICAFALPLFHPNVYPSGTICSSIIDADLDWKPSVTITQIL